MSMQNPWMHYRSYTRDTDVKRRLQPGTTRRIVDYAPNPGWPELNLLATIGAFTIAASVVPFLWNVLLQPPVRHFHNLTWTFSMPPSAGVDAGAAAAFRLLAAPLSIGPGF